MFGIRKTGYVGRHFKEEQVPATVKKSVASKVTRRVGVPILVIAAVLFGSGSIAYAKPVKVTTGDTFSALVRTHCKTNNWQGTALPGRNKNLIFAGETLNINCPGASAKAAPKPAKATPKKAPKPAAPKTTSYKGWVNPLPGAALTSCYGMRWGSLHTGLDMDGWKGEPVRSIAAGTVMAVGWIGSGYGREVFVYHGNGYWSLYEHLNGFAVHKGQVIKAGDRIGYVGNSGHIVAGPHGDGSHLHLNIAKYGKTSNVRTLYSHLVNPAPVLRAHGVKIGC